MTCGEQDSVENVSKERYGNRGTCGRPYMCLKYGLYVQEVRIFIVNCDLS